MSELRTIFRRCPNCGKRFEIHITGKKLVDEKVVSNRVQIDPVLMTSSPRLLVPTMMREGVTTVDEKEFRYAYECKHCGHKWFELVKNDDVSTSWNQTPKL